jgi:hypothetical protein
VIARLESIGITTLRNLADRDSDQLVARSQHCRRQADLEPPIATQGVSNLIAAAQRAKSANQTHPPAVAQTTAELRHLQRLTLALLAA